MLDSNINITGVGTLLIDDGDELDIGKLEKELADKINFNKKTIVDRDYTKDFENDISNLSGYKNIDVSHQDKNGLNNISYQDRTMSTNMYNPNKTVTFSNNSLSNLHSSNNSLSNLHSSSMPKNSIDFSDDESDDDKFNINDFKPDNDIFSNKVQTSEEVKQKQISNAINSTVSNYKHDNDYVQEDEDEDELTRIIEHIGHLRTNLTAEGHDLREVPTVSVNTDKKTARKVLRILQIKNDRMRYCDFFEEIILAGAYGLEQVFDGKNTYFNSKIDLEGWSDTVKIKLKRMRYDTSTFVGNIMKDYNIGPGWRILLELVPSIFLYSRDRKVKNNDNISTDTEFKKAMVSMADI